MKKSFNPDSEGLAGLQWDSAELFQVCFLFSVAFLSEKIAKYYNLYSVTDTSLHSVFYA